VEQVYGHRLGPALVTFHVQLTLMNWLATHLETGETGYVDVAAFNQGLDMLDVQNNLMWLPTVTNVPVLLAFRTPDRAPPPSRARASSTGCGGGGAAGATQHQAEEGIHVETWDPLYKTPTEQPHLKGTLCLPIT
jgi:hypothetical protein